MRRFEDLGPEFLRRVRTATALLGGIGVLYVALYAGWAAALGAVAGVFLSLINLSLLAYVFGRLLRPDPRWGYRIGIALVLKVPVLFGGAALALFVFHLPALWFSLGFSLMLAVIVLKVLGRFLLPSRRSAGISGDPARSAHPGTPRGRLSGRVGTIAILLLLVGPALVATNVGWSALHDWNQRAEVETLVLATPARAEEPHGNASHAPIEATHGQTGAHAAAAGAGHAEEEHAPEFPTIVTLLQAMFPDAQWVHFLHTWETPLFTLPVILLLCLIAFFGTRNPQMIPGKLQNVVEMAVETFADFIEGILGHHARHYLPFLGTLFFYIWFSNLQGLWPLMKSPTSVYNTTLALALCVFLYVQWTGLTKLGIKKYVLHLMGDPTDAIGWAMVILIFPLHVIGEFAKPVSLSLRLFGNVLGEDVLLAVFAGLGIGLLAFTHLPIGIPLHLPFVFLALLLSSIQALVFTLLTTIYFMQMLPHEEHEEAHA